MTVRYILKCYNDSCENFGSFVNEPEFDFEDEFEEQSFREAYGHGAEDDSDFCPFCGVLAVMDDVLDVAEGDVEHGART
ncbi:MAG: hypothetical protein AN484_18065 [Aphanizomenon flos-aquae WA102]|jgi:hypothetical protein|uniref:Uncharacterized protein n=1 Tax=Aphanizomenon flos-aquae WA102 TaxID=1710896 RepID=A0A1B7WZ62_APHFL|nr:MAG: hypothetical protein AN484_18065 [Aphanizomenon flos-aquae WA102]